VLWPTITSISLIKVQRRGDELHLVVLDFNQYNRQYSEKYLSRLRPSISSSLTGEPSIKTKNNAYPGFLSQEEDRCSYLFRQHFNVEDSRGAPIKQLELRSYVSLAPLMHGHAQDGKAKTQWTVWEDGFLEWVSMQNDYIWSTNGFLVIPLVTHGARCVEFLIGRGCPRLHYDLINRMVTTTWYAGTKCGVINIYAPCRS